MTRWKPWTRWRWPNRVQQLAEEVRDRALIREWSRQSSQPNALTLAQERRLRFEECARPQSAAPGAQPHLVFAMSLPVGVGSDSIRKLLNELASREPALRTTFHPSAEISGARRNQLLRSERRSIQPLGLHTPRVADRAVVPLIEYQTNTAASSPFEPEACEFILSEAVRPFAIDQAPLLKGMILTNLIGDSLLVIIADRLIADIQSMIDISEYVLTAIGYESWRAHTAVSEGCVLHAADLEDQRLASLRYWRDQGRDQSVVTTDDLPHALPWCMISGDLDCRFLRVPARMLSDLRRRFASKTDSLEIVFLSAFLLVLHHETQKSTMSVWTETRIPLPSKPELRVGARSHAHPLHVDLSEARSLGDLIDIVTASISQSRRHAHVPLDLLEFASRPMRAAPQRLGSQILVRHTSCKAQFRARGVEVISWPVFETDRGAALQLSSHETHSDASILLTYDDGRFESETIDEMLSDMLDCLSDWSTMDCNALRSLLVPSIFGCPPAACDICRRRGFRAQEKAVRADASKTMQ